MNDQNLKITNQQIVNEAGFQALRAIFLLNGGASLAILTFLGTMAVEANSIPVSLAELSAVLGMYGTATGLIVAAYGANYLNPWAQVAGYPKISKAFLMISVGLSLSSISLFFFGVYSLTSAFS